MRAALTNKPTSEPKKALKPSGLISRQAQRAGLMLVDKALADIAARGTPACTVIMRALEQSLSRPTATLSISADSEALSADARLILRARCGGCPTRCANPLL